MAYVSKSDFKTACDSVDLLLFKALEFFSKPLNSRIKGITYDDVIYVLPTHQKDLNTITHELVHTLQWSHFGPTGFLTRYIRGFVTKKLIYQNNPAEKNAYLYGDRFTKTRSPMGITSINATQGMV